MHTHRMLSLSVLVVIMAVLLFGCFRVPVTIHPEFDTEGKPKSIPVAPIGQVQEDGTFKPPYEVSQEAPEQLPPFDLGKWVDIGIQAILLVMGLGGAEMGRRGLKAAKMAKTALKITADLADKNADAETDEDVEKNKQIAMQEQLLAGVFDIVKTVRGK